MTYPVSNSTAAVISMVCQLMATLVSVSPLFQLPSISFKFKSFLWWKFENDVIVDLDGQKTKKVFRLSVVFCLSIVAMIGRQIAYKEATIAAALSIINFKGLTDYLTTLKIKMEREKGLVSLGLANYMCAISDALQIGWYGKYACDYTDHRVLGTVTLLALVSSFHMQLLFLAAGHDSVKPDADARSEPTPVGLLRNFAQKAAGVFKFKSSSHSQQDSNRSVTMTSYPPTNALHERFITVKPTPSLSSATTFTDLKQNGVDGDAHLFHRSNSIMSSQDDSNQHDEGGRAPRNSGNSMMLSKYLTDDELKQEDEMERELAGFIAEFFGFTLYLTLAIGIVFVFVASFRLHYLFSTPHCHKFCYSCHYSAVTLGGLDLLLIWAESRNFSRNTYSDDPSLRVLIWECTYFVWLHGAIVCTAVALNEWALMEK